MPIGRLAFVVIVCALACAGQAAAAAAQAAEAINSARQARGRSEAASAGRQTQPAPARGRGAATPPAQAPAAPAPAAPGQAVPAAPAPAAPVEPQGFTYNPEGRRDPFVSLMRRGGATALGGGAPGTRPPGLAGLGVNEVTLRGTVQSRDGFVAILQGADQKTYIVRPGDKLFDGTVRTITQNETVFLQQVNDPLSLEKQREVRKVLRQVEGQ
jgi:Tfp pilus assembly protein PilP